MNALTDSLGRLFDPQKFRNAKDKLGRWINARAGRKPGKTKAKKTPAPSPMQSPELPNLNETPAPAVSAVDYAPEATPAPPPAADPTAPKFDDIADTLRATAAPTSEEAHAFDLEGALGGDSTPTAETIIGIIQTALVLIGEEEGILSKQEKMLLRPPLERVLKKYNVGADVLPPEVDLAVCFAGLVITRLQKPKTARFAAKVRAWFVDLWFSHKGRKIQRVVSEENPTE